MFRSAFQRERTDSRRRSTSFHRAMSRHASRNLIPEPMLVRVISQDGTDRGFIVNRPPSEIFQMPDQSPLFALRSGGRLVGLVVVDRTVGVGEKALSDYIEGLGDEDA